MCSGSSGATQAPWPPESRRRIDSGGRHRHRSSRRWPDRGLPPRTDRSGRPTMRPADRTGGGSRPGTRRRRGAGSATAGHRRIDDQWSGRDGTGPAGRRSRPGDGRPSAVRTRRRSGTRWGRAAVASGRPPRPTRRRPRAGCDGPWPIRSQPPRRAQRWPGGRAEGAPGPFPSCGRAARARGGRSRATRCGAGRGPLSGRFRRPPGRAFPATGACCGVLRRPSG